MHRAPFYLSVLHGSIAVPPTHLYSAPFGVRLYQVAAHAPFVASLSSFVFGVVHCTVLAISRCNSAPLGVRLYQVAAHTPFVASFLSFVFGRGLGRGGVGSRGGRASCGGTVGRDLLVT